MIEHPTLFKRTATGAIQTWWIEQEDERYRFASGQLDGAITRSTWTICEGKNIGRKNETSPVEQSASEIESAYKIKLNQGRYWEKLEEVDQTTYFAPMLAHGWDKYDITKNEYDSHLVWAQPKLDGIRCIATKNGLTTRKGKPITAVPHIEETLKPLFDQFPELILDGELYNHEFKDRLNYLSGLVRRTKLKPDQMEEAKVLQYHVYDCYGWDETTQNDFDMETSNLYPDAPFQIRHLWMTENYWLNENFWNGTYGSSDVAQFPHKDALIHLVETSVVCDRELLDELHEIWVGNLGYEGQIIRIGDQPYENKRSKYLRKRKEFIDEEFRIVDIVEGDGNRSGMAGAVSYITKDGKEFRSGIAGGEEFYKHLFETREKYIGGTGTVRFFKYTEYGIPFHPVTHVLYEGERDL